MLELMKKNVKPPVCQPVQPAGFQICPWLRHQPPQVFNITEPRTRFQLQISLSVSHNHLSMAPTSTLQSQALDELGKLEAM